MAKQKDKVELELAAVLKTARTSIRLKHGLAADAEINEKLPEIEVAYLAAVQKGKAFKLEAFEL
jgi:hypothetical protein